MLDGLNRIVEQKKFSESEKANKALVDFRKQSDSVALFVEDGNYKPSDFDKIALADLYKKYKDFCHDDGYKPLGKNNFSKRLEGEGFKPTRLSGGAAAFFIKTEIRENVV